MQTVTADSNIYLSAIMFGGRPLQFLEMAIAGEIRLVISDAILQEILRVLRQKFRQPDDRIARAEAYITGCTERVAPMQTLAVIREDPDDDRILECALASGSDAIVTGDQDLLRLGEYGGIKIVKVADFLQRGRGR